MLNLRRDSRYADKIRSYEVILDGEKIGTIADGEKCSFVVKPGEHFLKLKIAWCSSKTIRFHVKENQEVHFRCANAMTGFNLLLEIFYVTIFCQRYIYLEQVD